MRVQERLDRSARIMRKYRVGNKHLFRERFKASSYSQLELAWLSAQLTLRSRDIIPEAASTRPSERARAREIAAGFSTRPEDILQRLEAPFDHRKMKLEDERVERCLRAILAEQFLASEALALKAELERRPNRARSPIRTRRLAVAGVAVALMGVLAGPRVVDGLTPVDVLAERIFQRSHRETRVGAICKDGWRSTSTGSGTCSHHGGVAEWLHESISSKTRAECLAEAQQRSWRD